MAIKKHFAALALGVMVCAGTSAQEVDLTSGNPEVNIQIDSRFDAQVNTFGKDAEGVRPDTEKGFKGSYLLLLISGKINDQFSYGFRYRMYKDNNTSAEMFNATDWLYLRYQADDRWAFTGGKQAVMIGTMEYDLNPIDVLYGTDFWNHVNPWSVGAAAEYRLNAGNTLSFQVTNSIFSAKAFDSLLAYNVMWMGKVADWWQVLNSVNMIEYDKGQYINYVALGNRMKIGRCQLDLDYMNRYGGKGTPVFTDFTVSGKLEWNTTDRVTLFTKAGYDQNHSQKADADFVIDRCVLPGVERVFYGAGIQYFPLVSRHNTIRLHAFWNSSNDKPRCQTFTVGLRWQMDLLRLKMKH